MKTELIARLAEADGIAIDRAPDPAAAQDGPVSTSTAA
jgi:hypothetical protein